MELRLYNTLTRSEEIFTPIDAAGRRVTFYACGPTVYDFAHIGNFRSFLSADVLRRTLELLGYEVRQVMNITDVGHMTEDDVADGAGEDKMEAAARRLREDKQSGGLPDDAVENPDDPYQIADYFAAAFLADARRLGLKVVLDADREPELMPRPTRYIEPMIELVEQLIAKGHAYAGPDGAVYFDVQSFPEYGRLSGNTPDRLRSGEGGRVLAENQSAKRHPADFMLWKPDPKHLMKWPSPWGEGYPGWHLECSVMAMSILGRETDGMIDIHSGGEDNIFPHHECEIAQSCCASGQPAFARHWFHTRFLIVEGQKMSKSVGNFFTVRDLLARGASPAAIRLELIRTHYRSNANFTFQGLRDSQRQIERWHKLATWLDTHRDAPAPAAAPLATARDGFVQALTQDLNVAGAIGALNEAVGAYRVDAPPAPDGGSAATLGDELAALRSMDSVLGVLDLEHDASAGGDDPDAALVENLIARRNEARAAKNWSEADRLRDELLEQVGVEIKDGPEGTTWSRVVR